MGTLVQIWQYYVLKVNKYSRCYKWWNNSSAIACFWLKYIYDKASTLLNLCLPLRNSHLTFSRILSDYFAMESFILLAWGPCWCSCAVNWIYHPYRNTYFYHCLWSWTPKTGLKWHKLSTYLKLEAFFLKNGGNIPILWKYLKKCHFFFQNKFC